MTLHLIDKRSNRKRERRKNKRERRKNERERRKNKREFCKSKGTIMRVREPSVAGMFYPRQREQCLTAAKDLLESSADDDRGGGRQPLGGLVPHAGWSYSGAVAARVLNALLPPGAAACVIIFGSVHRSRTREAVIFGSGRWETPLGPIEVDTCLAERICGHTNLIVDDPYAHEDEHSIEVQLPLIKHLAPEATIVPIMVPPVQTASEVGTAVAEALGACNRKAIVLGTTDLTHYGPEYGFTPHGIGAEGNRWAKEENDRRFIDLVCELRHAEVVSEADQHHNACGSGAAAATMAAVTALGASRGIVLEHTTSSEVTACESGLESTCSVGYVGIVFE